MSEWECFLIVNEVNVNNCKLFNNIYKQYILFKPFQHGIPPKGILFS